MKRVNVLWLSALVVIASCQKSDVTSAPDQQEISKRTGVHIYSISISTVNQVNPMCSDLFLAVKTDKSSKGTIVLYEYSDVYHRNMTHKWEADNTNSAEINTGTNQVAERYFDATFRWGSTIISGTKPPIEMASCPGK
jgi:hypothetical protein